jgi:hypothetical protein
MTTDSSGTNPGAPGGGTLNGVGMLAGGTGTGTVCFDAGITSGQQVLIIYTPAGPGSLDMGEMTTLPVAVTRLSKALSLTGQRSRPARQVSVDLSKSIGSQPAWTRKAGRS